MRLRGSVASTDAEMCEGSELGKGASAGSAMWSTAQQRVVLAGHDACHQVRLGERHAAAYAAEMHCC